MPTNKSGSVQEKATATVPGEWQAAKRWNPFNSYKLLAHIERWKNIKRGAHIPAPALVTVDPTNKCNLSCAWCNAAHIRSTRGFAISAKTLANLADFLPLWGKKHYPNFGINAICVAGGGEPLLNSATPEFIERVTANGIEVGMVSNGTLFSGHFAALAACTWIGVSVDAGSARVFDVLKGTKPEQNLFGKIVDGVSNLVDYSRTHQCMLGKPHPSYGVSFKYLLYKENIGEVYAAAKLAKDIGCHNIHFRPAGTTWDNIGTENEIRFTPEDVALFQEQIKLAFELDDETFSVYGVTHKFSEQFGRHNCFEKCHSAFMTAVFGPPTSKDAAEDSFVMGLCCDRRGDSKLELLTDSTNVLDIEKAWGSKRHWELHDAVNIQDDCPRCTYQPHNQIYENVIVKDSMTYKFI